MYRNSKCVENNYSLDLVKEKLTERDLYVETAADYVKAHLIFSRVFMQLIKGFILLT